MALQLTADQQAQIDPKRVSDAKLPKIFNRVSQADAPISRDFEAVLINLDRGTKQSAVGWAQALVAYEPEQSDLRAILAQYLDVEYDGLADRVTAALDGLGSFDDVKDGLAKATLAGGSTVPEVATLIADLGALLGDHVEKSDRAINGLILNRMLYRRRVEESDMAGIRSELKSFIPALLAY